MMKFFKNISMRSKLLSYAALMLTMLFLSFGYAILSLTAIGEELTTIVEEDIPMSNKLSKMTILQLEQSVSFERALHYGAAMEQVHTAKEHFDAAIAKFNARDQEIEQIANQVRALANHAIAVGDEHIKMKFSEILQSLTHIVKAHKSYVEHAHQAFAAFESGQMHLAEEIAAKNRESY